MGRGTLWTYHIEETCATPVESLDIGCEDWKSVVILGVVNTGLPEDLEFMEGRCYIHDAEQLRWATVGVEDARIARIRGNEHASMEAAKQGS